MSVPYAIASLTENQVLACCALEARAFNRLRQAWGQSAQPERRQDCLTHQIRLFPEGAYSAVADGRLIGFCISHLWGTLGWVGPIAVDAEWQGRGVGRELTRSVLRALQDRRPLTVALETWPHHPVNIQFYLTSGFTPGPLVFILEREISGEPASFTGWRLKDLPDLNDALRRLAELSGEVYDGLDYAGPIRTTLECRLGEVLVWGSATQAEAAALVHTASQRQGPPPAWAEVQLLMARPGTEAVWDECLRQLEGVALGSGRTRLRLSVPGDQEMALERLVGREGYRVVKVRLRMYHRRLAAAAPGSLDLISYAI